MCLSAPLLLLLGEREGQAVLGSGGERIWRREDELLRLRVIALRCQADPNVYKAIVKNHSSSTRVCVTSSNLQLTLSECWMQLN
jgi:hypothetical protein